MISSFLLYQGQPGLRGFPGPLGKTGPAVSDHRELLEVYRRGTGSCSEDLIRTAAMMGSHQGGFDE